jgi:hypothetical protein
MALDAAGSSLATSQPDPAAPLDGYQVTFRSSTETLTIGGGSSAPPALDGKQEQISDGAVTGTLTSAGERLLLVIDATASGAPPLRFPAVQPRLPLVQRGRIFVSAEHIDRPTFDRIVAGLTALRAPEFARQAKGQNSTNVAYLWPEKLPKGYSVDPATVRFSWDDYLLQGGLPFYEMTAVGPGNNKIIIKGGRQSQGGAFVLPEGADVEQVTTTIHGQPASAARRPTDALLIWAENNVYYELSSAAVSVEQLVAAGTGMRPIDPQEFLRRVQ